MIDVAVLFARKDSIYKTISGCDVYDLDRNAKNFAGGKPVVAHPPCRAWGDLYKLAKPKPGERELALWAIDVVRRFGGVLEHPKKSKLWKASNCLLPGQVDDYGGFLLPIHQNWFGHRAEKKTYLYIVGMRPADVPNFPLVLGDASHVVTQPGKRACGRRLKKGDVGWRPEITKAEREKTPVLLANWLVNVARECRV